MYDDPQKERKKVRNEQRRSEVVFCRGVALPSFFVVVFMLLFPFIQLEIMMRIVQYNRL